MLRNFQNQSNWLEQGKYEQKKFSDIYFHLFNVKFNQVLIFLLRTPNITFMHLSTGVCIMCSVTTIEDDLII